MSKYLPSDRLLCHQPLFIHDIITATVEKDQPLLLKTRRNLLFLKVKLVGTIVLIQHNQTDNTGKNVCCILHIDDGSATIPIHLSQRVYNREGVSNMKIGVWITIIGEVQKLGDSIIILGKGYQVEIEPMVELNHWLQVLVNNQTRMNDKKQPLSSSDYSAAQGMKRQKRSGSSLFVSLSSQPSPIRGSTEDLYPSPIRVDENDQISCSQITREAPWHWSPDHIAATSTPLMQSLFGSPYHIRPLTSGRSSPLCNTETAIITQQHNNNDDDDDDDDDFGFADDSQFEAMDFDDLEKKALENRAL